MSHGLIAERDPTGGGQESGVRRTAPRARLLDSQEREGRRHQGAGLDPFAAGRSYYAATSEGVRG